MASKKSSTDGTTTASPPKPGKVCPVSRKQFREKAPAAIEVVLDGNRKIAAKKEFDTGSLGYNLSNKLVLMIDGVPVETQVGLNITLVKSKELPKD